MASSGRYDTSFFPKAHYHLPVTKFRLCALTNTTNQPKCEKTLPTNHWIILLEHAPFKWTKLDLYPGLTAPDGRKMGVLSINSDVKFLDLVEAEQIIHEISLDVVDCQVITLTRDIGQARLSRYKFTELEEGGRYWIFKVVTQWEKCGRVAKGSADVVYQGLSQYYRYPNGVEARSMPQGEFY